jgi:hypothetical protein
MIVSRGFFLFERVSKRAKITLRINFAGLPMKRTGQCNTKIILRIDSTFAHHDAIGTALIPFEILQTCPPSEVRGLFENGGASSEFDEGRTD